MSLYLTTGPVNSIHRRQLMHIYSFDNSFNNEFIQIWWKVYIILKFFHCSSLTFSFKKFDYSKIDSSNCAIWFLKQTLCICVWKMCLLLYIITPTLRNWHLLWTTFHFNFLLISTKTFFSHKNEHCSYLILHRPINNIHLHLLYKS